MDLLDHARHYLADGWRLFPIWGVNPNGCDCGNPACKNVGKHPLGPLVPNGNKGATSLIEEVDYWLEQQPNMNLGVATGPESGIVVVDVDIDWDLPGPDGLESWATAIERHYPGKERYDLPVWTRMAKSGGGGMHLYFQHPGQPVKNVQKRFGPGIDIRGDGGSVTLPPSVHETGARYEWDEAEGEGWHRPLLPLPDWITVRCQNEPPMLSTGPRRPFAHTHRPPILTPGRNNELARIAGGIWKAGVTPGQLRTELQQINTESCVPPLDPTEVDAIARSIARYDR